MQISAVNLQSNETQRASQEARVFIRDGEHTFSAEFLNDEDVKRIPLTARLNQRENIYPDQIEVAGPFGSLNPIQSRRKCSFAIQLRALLV